VLGSGANYYFSGHVTLKKSYPGQDLDSASSSSSVRRSLPLVMGIFWFDPYYLQALIHETVTVFVNEIVASSEIVNVIDNEAFLGKVLNGWPGLRAQPLPLASSRRPH